MLHIEDWGMIEFHAAWERQKTLQALIQSGERDSTLVFCQHPSVITIGKAGSRANVLADDESLQRSGIQVVDINRGGDATLHNVGQLVGYTLFRLTDYTPDLHWFLREIEECVIETIAAFGLKGGRVEGLTGIWLEDARKICAIGLHCSRWVTSHGFALNVCNNIAEFSHIIPCGIQDKAVTSLYEEAKKNTLFLPNFSDVQLICQQRFEAHFV
ncbi:MAG: lipoyl(octanoyl) transferase LipB [Candidatus Kapaibacterium sp.]|nr:MAG: lipoyl(octanoyl) transferase LipB [Candidatus Kapabacteria bacterium]